MVWNMYLVLEPLNLGKDSRNDKYGKCGIKVSFLMISCQTW